MDKKNYMWNPDKLLCIKNTVSVIALNGVCLTYKNDIAWNKTVNRMAEFDYPNITDSDMRYIVAYLIRRQRRRWRNTGRLKTGKNIVSRKRLMDS
jgi:hypothetical protein